MSTQRQPMLDPDVDRAAGRPLGLRPGYLLAIFFGGTAGTLARWLVGELLPARDGWPWGTLAVNLAGALALGVLLEWALHRPDRGVWRLTRLGLGTGFLGAFTTYSALAVETMLLAGGAHWLQAAGYLLATVLGGQLCALAGIALGNRLVRSPR